MSEHHLNPTALRAAQPRQAPPSIPIGENHRLFGFTLVPVPDQDGETVHVALVAHVGKPSLLSDTIPVRGIVLGDYSTVTMTELRAKFDALEATEKGATSGD